MSIHRFALALAGVLTCSPALAGQFRFVSFDLDGTSFATGINASGQVTGVRGSASLPFVWTNGTFATLPPGPGGVYPSPEAISDTGVVAGILLLGYNGPFPIVDYYRFTPRTNKVVTVPATVFGANPPVITGVDNAGVAVGYSPVMTGPIVSVVVSGHTEQIGGLCSGYEALYVGINSRGVRTGYCTGSSPVIETFKQKGNSTTSVLTQYYLTSPKFIDYAGRVGGLTIPAEGGTVEGFLYRDDGTARLFSNPHYADSELIGTGPEGQILGQSSTLTDGFWVHQKGKYITVHLPADNISSVNFAQVNSSGSVVGTYVDTNSVRHGFAEICDADQVPCTQ